MGVFTIAKSPIP